MDVHTLIILPIVIAAALYVARSLWPASHRTGCSSCPQNRDRRDDYV